MQAAMQVGSALRKPCRIEVASRIEAVCRIEVPVRIGQQPGRQLARSEMDKGLTATLRASGHRMLIAMPHASVRSRLTAMPPVSARSSRRVITR
jgi:hypothetical protein